MWCTATLTSPITTPPRTWRRPSEDDKVLYFVGKHLHGRGEDPSSICGTRARLETPPRTWRRLIISGRGAVNFLKHLHGRGEDLHTTKANNPAMETPPRTWRRPVSSKRTITRHGNTSTDVEKTSLPYPYNHSKQKHLHGRGEDNCLRRFTRVVLETPPRTWRRPTLRPADPSGAEKHLHGRGEDDRSKQTNCGKWETPPRTWRRPETPAVWGSVWGNTSTDVEKTKSKKAALQKSWKHLHGRGEDSK